MISFSKLLTLTIGISAFVILPTCNTLFGRGRDVSCIGCQLADTANRGFFGATPTTPAVTNTIAPKQ